MTPETGRYEVLSVLGQGGFGTVYHARFLGEGGFVKQVALKVLNPDMEGVAEVASRLRDEARVLGLIRHRAIVGVDRLTQLDGRWTVVMEYVEGHDLVRLLEDGPMPPAVALEIAAEIAGALHAAYSRPGPNGSPLCLLHRDLKPSNVRITPFGEVKVLDFGIARAEFERREAKTRSLAFGTPEYMSPERLDFSGDTAAGDVYALGAVLFELLTAEQLGRTSANPNKHVHRLDLAAEALSRAAAPAPVVELLWQMLSFEEEDRPSAAEVERRAAALARNIGGRSLREWADDLPPPGVGERMDPMTGSILVERPETPDPETRATVWQRASTPAPRPARGSPSPMRLTPAATEGVSAEPIPPPPVVPSVAERSLENLAAPISVPVPVPVPEPRVTRAPAPELPSLPVSRPVSRRTPGLALWTGLMGAALLAVLVVGGLTLLWRDRAGEQVQASPSPAGGASAEKPTPPVASTTGAAPDQAATKPAPDQGAAQPAVATAKPSVAAAAQPTTKPATKPAPAQTAPAVTVSLTGDATSVSLVADPGGKTYKLPSSRVAPGSYRIFAAFGDAQPAVLGSVDVVEGRAIAIHCDSRFGLCTAPGGGY